MRSVGAILLFAVVCSANCIDAKVLSKCEIVQALLDHGFQRSFLSNWVCLIQAESGGDTKKVDLRAGRGKYGLFQLENGVSCEKSFDGGDCQIRCSSLLTDNLDGNNAACAKKFYRDNGFKGWKQWVEHCKQKDLPNIRDCL